MEQFGNLETMSVEEAMGSLKAHEERTKGRNETSEGKLMLTEEEWQKREIMMVSYFSLEKNGLNEVVKQVMVSHYLLKVETRVEVDVSIAVLTDILQPSVANQGVKENRNKNQIWPELKMMNQRCSWQSLIKWNQSCCWWMKRM